MEECCKKTLRKAADVVAGSVPSPIGLIRSGGARDYAKRVERMLPLVRMLFHARDRILELDPDQENEAKSQDNLKKYGAVLEDHPQYPGDDVEW